MEARAKRVHCPCVHLMNPAADVHMDSGGTVYALSPSIVSCLGVSILKQYIVFMQVVYLHVCGFFSLHSLTCCMLLCRCTSTRKIKVLCCVILLLLQFSPLKVFLVEVSLQSLKESSIHEMITERGVGLQKITLIYPLNIWISH